jgi:hypothetical protein
MKHTLPLFIIAFLLSPISRAADPGFSFQHKPGEHLDVLLDGKTVARYMYAHDTSTKERHNETYKPYLHVFNADGTAPITQGAGGKQFPHHRGIYIGWNKISANGKSYDRWHMKGGDQVHRKFTGQKAAPDSATFTFIVTWDGDSTDKRIIEEERTFTFRRPQTPGGIVTIDFASKLNAVASDVTLGGDPEHAGIHFRPHGDIVANETQYLYPKELADAKKDTDYPWVGQTFTLHGKQYSVVQFSHPDNPKGTRWSAYRNYGRFGAFPTATIKQGDTLTLKYRFTAAQGDQPPAEQIQKAANDFTGAQDATPKTTAKPADGAKKPVAAK